MTWLAEPVHLVAGLRSVHLDYAGLLRLDAQTQTRFIESFDADFRHVSYKLAALPSGTFILNGPNAAALTDRDPARYLGSTIESAMPTGEGTAILQRLAGEIEMWLHDHPINAARIRERQRPISTLWLWGGSSVASDAHAQADARERPNVSRSSNVRADRPSCALFGNDPYIAGLARLIGTASQATPNAVAEVLAPRAEHTALVVEAFRLPERSSISTPLQALEEIDRRWIAPAFDALARGEIQRLSIVANDRCLSVRSRDRLKLWRRRRGALAGWQ